MSMPPIAAMTCGRWLRGNGAGMPSQPPSPPGRGEVSENNFCQISVWPSGDRDRMARGVDQILALDTALEELARIQPRQAMMVESRFFGGLDITETATLLEVSEATILRDWRAAKAWLAHELRRTH